MLTVSSNSCWIFFSATTTILRSELPRKMMADLIMTNASDVRFLQTTTAMTTSSFFLQYSTKITFKTTHYIYK